MKKRLVAFIFIVVLAVGLVPGLELVAPQDVLSAAGITGTSQALAEESTTTSKITVTRLAPMVHASGQWHRAFPAFARILRQTTRCSTLPRRR